tara:strand:+ start:168 stop:488 length:321 start_codon:yes stop_codon:yes gene_type:complete
MICAVSRDMICFQTRAPRVFDTQTLYAGANGWPRRGRDSSGMHMTQKSLTQQRDELTIKLEQLEAKHADLHKLVNTLLTIIMEEADGVQSGAAPTIKNQPTRGYCM